MWRLHHVPQHSFIKLLRPVCCTHDEHPVISSRLHLKPGRSPTSKQESPPGDIQVQWRPQLLSPRRTQRGTPFSVYERRHAPPLSSHTASCRPHLEATWQKVNRENRAGSLSVRWRHIQPTGRAVRTNKDDGGLQFSGHCKQRPHKLLSFSHL